MLDMRFVMCHAVKIETHSNSKGSAKAHDVHIRCDSRCIDQIYDHFFLLAFAVSLQSIDHIILSIYLIVIAVEKKKKQQFGTNWLPFRFVTRLIPHSSFFYHSFLWCSVMPWNKYAYMSVHAHCNKRIVVSKTRQKQQPQLEMHVFSTCTFAVRPDLCRSW